MGESIVVGTDGSERADRAVDEAVRLAKALGAQLHVVSAYEPLRGAKIAGAPEGAATVWAPLPDSTVESTLSQTAASARLKGDLEVTTHAVKKDPADALLSVAADVDADLIVVGNHGMHGAKRLLGSVPNEISHKARCNVLIVSTEA
ncbi:MAG: universal stress protein, partial [Actinomycetota bacterium]|nr:universal stress protein [Actinomycetota bacterium]